MQFIKKNYEKVLLGLVLVGLLGVVGFLPIMVSGEKSRLDELRDRIIHHPPKPIEGIEGFLKGSDELLKRAATPIMLKFADNQHKLFNPVRWQKSADGRLYKNPAGRELEKLEITKIIPLDFIVSLERVEQYDTGPRYGFGVTHQVQSPARIPVYVSAGEKKQYTRRDGQKESLTLQKVEGPADDPAATVQMSNLDGPVTVTKEKPFKLPEAYAADLRYPPDNNKTFLNQRVGDTISVAGEGYKIVAIDRNKVVLSANSNQKRWTITYNPAQ